MVKPIISVLLGSAAVFMSTAALAQNGPASCRKVEVKGIVEVRPVGQPVEASPLSAFGSCKIQASFSLQFAFAAVSNQLKRANSSLELNQFKCPFDLGKCKLGPAPQSLAPQVLDFWAKLMPDAASMRNEDGQITAFQDSFSFGLKNVRSPIIAHGLYTCGKEKTAFSDNGETFKHLMLALSTQEFASRLNLNSPRNDLRTEIEVAPGFLADLTWSEVETLGGC